MPHNMVYTNCIRPEVEINKQDGGGRHFENLKNAIFQANIDRF